MMNCSPCYLQAVVRPCQICPLNADADFPEQPAAIHPEPDLEAAWHLELLVRPA